MNKNNQLLMVPVMLLAIFAVALSPQLGNYLASAQAVEPSTTCEMRVTLLNNRSRLLSQYKHSENKQFKLVRDKWSARIAYASRWIEKDANKARAGLYHYDKLHKNLEKELDKQIESYKYLETTPLDCTDEKKTELANKLKEVKGVQNRKAVGGQALIQKLKDEEAAYVNQHFEKSMESLVKNLHQDKARHPAPRKEAFKVEAY